MAEKVTNSFEGGMKKDLDKKLRANNTYSLGVNGRLIYNDDGSLSWENMKGNIIGINNFPTGIKNRVLGKAEFSELVILFLIVEKANGDFVSEIGAIVFNPDGEGLYNRLYNDDYDVNNLLLKFSPDHQIEAVPFIESDELHRVYFTDDYNQPRVFTFKKVSYNNYIAITDSAFTVDILPDFNMGTITYEGDVSGALSTGQYQYSYRLITKDGYATPWTPLTYNIFVNIDDVSNNSQSYDMGDTNVTSNKGLRVVVKEIDTRYDEIQVAYVHSIVSAGAKEAGVFADTEITGTSMGFNHVSTTGVEPLNIAALSDIKDFILKAKTIAIKDNRLWFGNVEGRQVNDIPDAAFEGFYAEPEYRGMTSDDRADKNITKKHSQGFSATNVNPGNLVFKKRKYQRYDISNVYELSSHPFGSAAGTNKDYSNYKGRQTCHSFTGYFRGEKYRFAGVFFDKKGFPLFAKHLADVKFPDAFGSYAEGDAQLVAERVRSNGSIQTKTVSVGKFGAAITSGRVGREVLENVNIGGSGWDWELNHKLFDNAVINQGSSSGIIGQYHLAFNAPMKFISNTGNPNKPNNTYYYQKTPTLWSNLNNIVSDNHNTSENHLRQSLLRLQGVRFGGIDLNVDLGDGTKLKDVIGGFMIVRTERTGDNETIKDTGLLLNCTVPKDSTDGIMRPRSNPFMGTSQTVGTWMLEGQGILTLDESNTTSSAAYVKPHAFTFEGVNHKIEGVSPNIKNNSTEIKYMYDAMTSVMGNIAFNEDINGLAGIDTEDVKLKHHWVAKFEDTINKRKLNDDDPQNNTTWLRRWIRYNKKTTIKGFKDIPLRGESPSGVGTINNPYSSTTWLAVENVLANEITKASLKMFYNYDGANSGTSGDDSKLSLKGVNGRHLLLDLQVPYINGHGIVKNNLTSPNNYAAWWFKTKELAVPVVALYQKNDAQYGGTTEIGIQTSRFHSTGHFQPINDAVLSQINDNGNYVLNELEIWGGDCYLDFFEFLRIYPQFDEEEQKEGDELICAPVALGKKGKLTRAGTYEKGDAFRDYSCAVIYPVESKYNFKLRVSDTANGRPIWADSGSTNGATVANASPDKDYMILNASLDGLYASTNELCPSVQESFDVNDVLQYFDKVRSFNVKPISYIENVDFPTRWNWSNKKQPFNARIDKFRQFEELSNFDLDGVYGEVTGNAMLFDAIYSMQEKAFGRLQILDRALVATSLNSDLTLGEGGIMDGIDYISKTYGSQHQWSIKASDKNIYWADANMRKLIRFGQDGLKLLSDEMGIHSYIAPYLETAVGKDNPATVGGIVTAYDYDNNDVIFTFRLTNNNMYSGNPWYISGEADLQVDSIGVDWEQDIGDGNNPVGRYIKGLPSFFGLNANQSIIFNEQINTFTGIGTFYPTIYFNHGKHLYSNNNNKSGDIYIYNRGNRGQFMGVSYYSAMQYVINKYPNAVKRFDVSIMNINEDSLGLMERVLMKTENNFQVIPSLANEIVNISGYGGVGFIRRAKWRQGLLKFPTREKGKRDRLTGKQAEFIVYFKNQLNKKVSLTSVDTLIRLHNKI